MAMLTGEYAVARKARFKAQQAAYDATDFLNDRGEKVRNQAVGVIESEFSTWQGRASASLGYKQDSIFSTEDFGKNSDEFMTKVYQDISEGINPLEAFEKHIVNYDVPQQIKDVLVERVKQTDEFLSSGETIGRPLPQYPSLSQEEFDYRFTGEKIAPKASEVDAKIDQRPRLRPIGEPTDIGTSVGSPGAPKVNQPYTPKKAPGLSEPKRKFLVDEKGNTILVDETTEQVKAQIKHDLKKIPRGSTSGQAAQAASTKQSLRSGASIADQVVKGAKNSNNLRVAGIAALLGVGGLGYSRLRNNMNQRNAPSTRNGPIDQGY